MKNKGFTLIELLAVIVILALIALVTIPLIGNVIEKSKKEAFKDSVLSAFNAVEHYILKNNVNLNENGINVKDLSLKNNNFISGRIIKNTNGKLVAEFLSDGKYCATGLMTNLKINKGECEITSPIIEVTVNAKEASINITDEYGIVGYIITETEEEPTNWNEVKELTNIVETITADHAGTYYIYTKNKYGKISKKEYLINSSAFCAYQPGDVVGTFNYTGGTQSFTVPCDGTYKLEVYGAQGGAGTYSSTTYNGGKGGYSSGIYTAYFGQKLYIEVGGMGKTYLASSSSTSYVNNGLGYNGGGDGLPALGNSAHGGGGGATHIATVTGTLESIGVSNLSKILIVAGGGGGGASHRDGPLWSGTGGSGGGLSGGSSIPASSSTYCNASGGTQTSGGKQTPNVESGCDSHGTFGVGSNSHSGGGGGYYGGAAGLHGPAGGGSGYIGGVNDGAMQNGVNSGNGKAVITYIAS